MPALTVAKSSPTANYSAVGDTIDYGFLVTNTGNVTLSTIAVDDTEAAPATQANLSAIACPDSTLAPATAETCTATYTVTAADMAHGSVRDTATASGTPPGSVTPVTSGSSGTTVNAYFAFVTLTKSATTTTLTVGSRDTFTLTAANAGPSESGQVVVTDVLPNGLGYVSSTPSNCVSSCVGVTAQTVTWTVSDLAPGANATLQVVVKGTAPGAVLNTASFTQAVPNGAGSFGGTSNTVGVNVVGPPDLAIKFGTTALTPGQTTTVRYTITNPGDNPVSLTGVGFTDHVAAILRVADPANPTTTCPGGSVAATFGGSTVILSDATLGIGQSCTVTVNVVAVATGTGTESATVTSTNGGVGNTVHVDVLAANAPPPPYTGASSSSRWATVGLLIVGALFVFAFGIARRRHRMSRG
jgi:uncharacterized repeat protein (TIGR01451 family)